MTKENLKMCIFEEKNLQGKREKFRFKIKMYYQT